VRARGRTCSGGSENTENGGIYQLRPYLSQMRTAKYMPFTRKKRLFGEKYEPVGVGGAPTAPSESATACMRI